MLFCSRIFYSFFSFVLSFYFNKMKIELGSKLCEPLLSTFAEFSTGCMHPADPLFVNFSSLIAAMEMWSKIMIFSCDKWSSQGRNQHMFLILFWGEKCNTHLHVTFYSGSCSLSRFFLSALLHYRQCKKQTTRQDDFWKLKEFQSNRATLCQLSRFVENKMGKILLSDIV